MKINNKFLMAAGMIAASVSSLSIQAQNTTSGYFLDNYTYRYQMNPAFGNETNFVSFPGLGNLNLAMRGSMHLTDIFHVVDGKTVLFTNPEVSASFLNNVPKVGRIGFDLKENILSGGWKAWGGYNTVSINARAFGVINVPRTFLELMKEGLSNRTYSISDMSASASAWAEIALNHSREIPMIPGLRVGAAVKFELGKANVQANFREADLALGTDAWTARTNADIYMNLGKTRFATEINNENRPYVSGIDDISGIGVNGFGMAFDLGATYKWNEFDFSLAINDLGWISYSNTAMASTNGTKEFTTDAYTFEITDSDGGGQDVIDRMTDDLGRLYQLEDMGNTGTRNVAMGATLNVGVNYTLPMYRRLHFGILSSSRFQKDYTWTEVRVSANVNPVDCFSADVNVAFGTYGAAFGWLLNFYHKGFNIFLGMDNTLGKLARQGIPLNSNASVNLGINFPF